MRPHLPRLLQGRRPSPALIISSLALVVATGGTSYAAVMITGQDIKNGTVSSKDIRNNTLKSKDVKNKSLRAKDFRAGDLPEGPAGPQGPAGAGRWALVNAAGQIEAQSGGFSVTAGYPALPSPGNGNVYINANEPLGNNGVLAVVALQNRVDQNGDGVTNGRAPGADANPEFSGEISVSQCAPTNTASTNCAPTGTNNVNHFVVSPRLSDGSVTDDSNRKRFYVIVTGDSTDYVAPAA